MSFNIDSNDLFKKIGTPEEIGGVQKTQAEESESDKIIDMVPQAEEGKETTDAEKLDKAEYEFEMAAESYLNTMFSDKSVINALDGIVDGVKDGVISGEERNAFLKEIAGNDNYITFDEINAGLKAHGYGATEEKAEEKEEDEDYSLKDLAEDMSNAIGGAAQMGAMATQAAAQQMSNSMAQGFNSVNSALSDIADKLSGNSKLDAKSLQGMSLEELKEEQNNREDQLKTAESELQQAQSNYQEALQKEQEMTEELKTKQKENQDAIDSKQEEIEETQNDIVDKEAEIKDKEDEISNIENTISNLQSELSNLVIPGPVYDEYGNVTNQGEIDAAIQKKQELEAKLQEEQKKLEKAQGELETLQGERDTLEKTLSTQQEELTGLETERTEIETEIMNSNCSEETKQALKNFNEADKNQYTAQNNLFEVNRKIAQEE